MNAMSPKPILKTTSGPMGRDRLSKVCICGMRLVTVGVLVGNQDS